MPQRLDYNEEWPERERGGRPNITKHISDSYSYLNIYKLEKSQPIIPAGNITGATTTTTTTTLTTAVTLVR